MHLFDKLDFDQYFMQIAETVARRSNCLRGRKVGAVIAQNDRIVSTGYNGTPEGIDNCKDGGCGRCRRAYEGKRAPKETCVCVHAELNAVLAAARFGILVEGATLYTTVRPCFTCTKEMLQAKIAKVFYLHDWNKMDRLPKDLRSDYEKIQGKLGVVHLGLTTPIRTRKKINLKIVEHRIKRAA